MNLILVNHTFNNFLKVFFDMSVLVLVDESELVLDEVSVLVLVEFILVLFDVS